MCGKHFRDNASLRAHSRVHSGEQPFSCAICQKSFAQKGNMERHLKTHNDKLVHEEEQASSAQETKGITSPKPPSAPQDSLRSQVQPSALQMPTSTPHVPESTSQESTSTSSVPIRCQVCGIHIRSIEHLREHSRTRCSDLKKSLNTGSNMKEHLKTHNNDWAFFCNLCQKGFMHEATMRNHLKTHKVFMKYTKWNGHCWSLNVPSPRLLGTVFSLPPSGAVH